MLGPAVRMPECHSVLERLGCYWTQPPHQHTCCKAAVVAQVIGFLWEIWIEFLGAEHPLWWTFLKCTSALCIFIPTPSHLSNT